MQITVASQTWIQSYSEYDGILFDLDGTLTNIPWLDHRPRHVLLGRLERIQALREAGYAMAVVSNQAGLLWRLVTGEEKYPSVREFADELNPVITLMGLDILWYLSLYDERAITLHEQHTAEELFAYASMAGHSADTQTPPECETSEEVLERLKSQLYGAIESILVSVDITPQARKPAPKMLKEAMRSYMGANRFLMVGDRREDQLAARAAGIDFVTAIQFFEDQIDPSRDYVKEGTLVTPEQPDPVR